jgi:hypothetical protein
LHGVKLKRILRIFRSALNFNNNKTLITITFKADMNNWIDIIKKFQAAVLEQPLLGSIFITDFAILLFHRPPFFFSLLMMGALVAMAMYFGQKLAFFKLAPKSATQPAAAPAAAKAVAEPAAPKVEAKTVAKPAPAKTETKPKAKPKAKT